MRDWLWLGKVGTPKDRADIEDKEVDVFVEERLKNIQVAIAEIRAALFFKGVKASDDYHQMLRKTSFSNESTRIYPRVRWDERYSTPSFSWERLVCRAYPVDAKQLQIAKQESKSYVATFKSMRTGNDITMRIVWATEQVCLNKETKKVSKAAFARQPEWVRLAASIVDERLSVLRRQNNMVAEIGRVLKPLIDLSRSGKQL